jgi:hypothetical protein
MTDRPKDPQNTETEAELVNLETADPADAPQIAEDLADQLAHELERTSRSHTSEPEGTS